MIEHLQKLREIIDDLEATLAARADRVRDAIKAELEPQPKPAPALNARIWWPGWREAMHLVNLPLTEAAAEEMLADNKALRSERDALKAELGALKEEHQVCGNLVTEICRQERERIIALLDEDGHPSVCVVNWDMVGEDHRALFGSDLRAFLEPKPEQDPKPKPEPEPLDEIAVCPMCKAWGPVSGDVPHAPDCLLKGKP